MQSKVLKKKKTRVPPSPKKEKSGKREKTKDERVAGDENVRGNS